MSKLKIGTKVLVNIPFVYEIGDEGYYTGKTLKTIEDCEAEVLAEVEAGVLNEGVFLEFKIESDEK